LRSAEDLRRELTKVRRELTLAQKPSTGTAPSREDLKAAESRGYERGVKDGESKGERIAAAHVKALRARTHKALEEAFKEEPVPIAWATPPAERAPPPKTREPRPITNGHGESLPIGEAAVLRACIQYPEGLEREQLTILTGYKRSSRDAYIARVAARGYVTTAGKIVATEEGFAAMPDAEPLPTGEALQDFWRGRLPEGERKILDMLIEAYPTPMARDQLDEPTGYKRSSRDAYLSRLAAKELVSEAGRGLVLASQTLFA
jgi:hypothetical protein